MSGLRGRRKTSHPVSGEQVVERGSTGKRKGVKSGGQAQKKLKRKRRGAG